ncbi:unnamed protein product, partial [Musa textilis]
ELLKSIEVEHVGGTSRVDHDPFNLGVGNPCSYHQRVMSCSDCPGPSAENVTSGADSCLELSLGAAWAYAFRPAM